MLISMSLPSSPKSLATVNGSDETARSAVKSSSKPIPERQSEQQLTFKPTRGFLLAFGSILIITLAAAIDATSLSIAIPTITNKLNGTAIEAFWSGTSFLLTSAVSQPVLAGMSHVFGRKSLILISTSLFALGAILAGIAKNFTYMCV